MRPVMAQLDLKLITTPVFAGWVLIGTVLMCLAASLISFRKVASIDPALVFRS
jgi:putative ABC transport system permease protein